MKQVMSSRILVIFLSVCMMTGVCVVPESIGLRTAVRAEESILTTQDEEQAEPEKTVTTEPTESGSSASETNSVIKESIMADRMNDFKEFVAQTNQKDKDFFEAMYPDDMASLDEEDIIVYEVKNIQDLVTILGTENVSVKSDTEIMFTKDILFPERDGQYLYFSDRTYTIDFNGYTCSYICWYFGADDITLQDTSSNGDGGLIIKGLLHRDLILESPIKLRGANLTIKSGHYYGFNNLISASHGNLIIEGGSFTGVNIYDEDTDMTIYSTNAVFLEPPIQSAKKLGGDFKAGDHAVYCSMDLYYDTSFSIPIPLKISGGNFMSDWTAIWYIDTASEEIPNIGELLAEDCFFIPARIYGETVYNDIPGQVSHSGAATEACVRIGKTTGVEGFVCRLYEKALGRTPDYEGFSNWLSLLTNKQSSGSDVAFGFFFSPEMANRNLSDKEFITLLYNVFLNRGPDEAGMKNWLTAIWTGASRKYVFAGFANSQEWKGLCETYSIEPGSYASDEGRNQNLEVTAFVIRLYNLCLGRDADADGLNHWTSVLNDKTQDVAHVAYGFFFSEEFKNRNLSNEDYVEALYKVLLGRDSDSAGKANWVKQLDNGTDRMDVFRGFVHSQEFDQICANFGIVRGTI